MGISMKFRHLPARLATGAFILNSGLSKRDADDQTVEFLHGTAKNVYPFLADVEPRTFVKALSTGEIALGAALLLPIVPSALAGAALTAFSGGLLGLYAKTPGMRKEGSILPTEQGVALAKDSWMFGIGLTLVLDGFSRH